MPPPLPPLPPLTGSKSARYNLVQTQPPTNGFRSASVNSSHLLDHIAGKGVSGILQKWVNYGKGWRRRWFVLQDEVLSYYKIHGPNKIDLNLEIGNANSSLIKAKPFGEVHLKVSSIKESKSDDKRFSIYTGTKRLHLRAETREERDMWMESLRAVKETFPRISNGEHMVPIEYCVVSTEKLRERLLKEGVSEAAIQDSERIMMDEFAALHNQLTLLKQKHDMLIDTLRQLESDGLVRILNLAAFAVSGYASTEGRECKPFNPLLGETYEAHYPDKGLRFFSEKVSHHPMVVACHCEGTGWKFWGDSTLKSKFWGRSIQLDPIGVLTLEFDDGEVFQWSKVTTSIYNLILGKLYCDHYGTMHIQGNREYSCKLKFKEQSIIDRNPHQVHGLIQDRSGRIVATLFGKWDESMYYVFGDYSKKGKGPDLSEARLLWKRSKPSHHPTRYNLTRFAITMNELTPGLKEKLPPTDSRLRPDQRCLENGEYEMANAEKLRLEQRQRQARKMQERGWQPRWFAKDESSGSYRYVGGYWEAREMGNWDGCPDIFGQLPVDHITDSLNYLTI